MWRYALTDLQEVDDVSSTSPPSVTLLMMTKEEEEEEDDEEESLHLPLFPVLLLLLTHCFLPSSPGHPDSALTTSPPASLSFKSVLNQAHSFFQACALDSQELDFTRKEGN